MIEFLLWPLPPWCPKHVLILPKGWSSTSPLPPNVWPQRQVHLFQESALTLDVSWLNTYSIRVWQFHLFSIPLVNCKSCVLTSRQYCHHHPQIRRLNTLIVGPWYSNTFSLPRVSHRDRCIYSNTTPPSPGVHHIGPRHVVIRHILQLHPPTTHTHFNG